MRTRSLGIVAVGAMICGGLWSGTAQAEPKHPAPRLTAMQPGSLTPGFNQIGLNNPVYLFVHFADGSGNTLTVPVK